MSFRRGGTSRKSRIRDVPRPGSSPSITLAGPGTYTPTGGQGGPNQESSPVDPSVGFWSPGSPARCATSHLRLSESHPRPVSLSGDPGARYPLSRPTTNIDLSLLGRTRTGRLSPPPDSGLRPTDSPESDAGVYVVPVVSLPSGVTHPHRAPFPRETRPNPPRILRRQVHSDFRLGSGRSS